MGCSTTLTGIPVNCDKNVGGIKNLYINSINNVFDIEIDNLNYDVIKNLNVPNFGFENYTMESITDNVIVDLEEPIIEFIGLSDNDIIKIIENDYTDIILTNTTNNQFIFLSKKYVFFVDSRLIIDFSDNVNNFLNFKEFILDGADDFTLSLYKDLYYKFQTYSFKRGNAQFTSTGLHDDKSQTTFYTTEISVNFNKQDKYKRNELKEIIKGLNYVIVEDYNGIFHFIGYDSYVTGNVVANSGSEMGDANNYVLTMNSITKNLPHIIEFSDTFLKTNIIE